uniref:Uncharacterized protein n=1 Tax=viral metagenome TaxID=1070528 RepID=A0A6C0BAZ1_9ZZZZ
MEFAIPLIALGGMYVASNQKKDSYTKSKKKDSEKKDDHVKENYTNMGRKINYLPNTDIPPQNYPIPNETELVNTVQRYSNPNVATDKYFDQNLYEKNQNNGVRVGNNIQEIYSLTGNYLDSSEFKHNNMVPFYGGKIKGQLYNANTAETLLDNMVGSGSQVTKKIEQAPLFKPQEHMQWAYGAPNMSDFYQSRVNPGMNNANVKPFESITVGPGLNKGYTTTGSGGYNSGMEARDEWLPKTVDQLRVETNPKLEYSLENHEGPSYSHVQNRGILGKVEKYHPDTFFIQTQDRWLTTTGQEKGQALRPVQEVHGTNRQVTSQSYVGTAASNEVAGYAPSEFQPSRNNVLPAKAILGSAAVGRGEICNQSPINSLTNYSNNRSTIVQPDTMRSGFSRAIGAVIAPFTDMFRPTRKEEFGPNVRVYGDAVSGVAQGYVYNPADITPTTIKETTLYTPNLFIDASHTNGTGYLTAEQQPIFNQRDTTNCSTIGNAGGSSTGWGEMSHEAANNQRNNDVKQSTVASWTNHGNSQIFNQQMNVNVARIDSDRDNTRMWVPSHMPQMPMSKETYGKIRTPQYYNECIGCDRIEPDLLTAFKSNPYTHSLTNCV